MIRPRDGGLGHFPLPVQLISVAVFRSIRRNLPGNAAVLVVGVLEKNAAVLIFDCKQLVPIV